MTDAAGFIDALPASVVMPAGAGKTHLLAAATKHVIDGGGKVLVITHTNAGVHAVAARLKRFGVTTGVQITTITSFAFRLARAYPVLGDHIVPRVMVPDDSLAYVQAATRALAGRHVQAVLRASYTHVLVDEYQDCNVAHHAMVLKIKDTIGSVGVLGDPLQAIFGFSDELPDWDEVLSEFPSTPTSRLNPDAGPGTTRIWEPGCSVSALTSPPAGSCNWATPTTRPGFDSPTSLGTTKEWPTRHDLRCHCQPTKPCSSSAPGTQPAAEASRVNSTACTP